MAVLIGTAGWSLPRVELEHFPDSGSHLERYAAQFQVAEINSSFHRSHRAATWSRWRDSVPETFRFSVKLPKAITHTHGLTNLDLLIPFLEEVSGLGDKVGCLLVQLPPKLGFAAAIANKFFQKLRALTSVRVACEPRHESWFAPEPNQLLERCEIARVAADPPRVLSASLPGGWRGFSYYRLHGSPRIYYSAYSAEFIAGIAKQVRKERDPNRDVWVIFDNTTLGAATRNALDLAEALGN